MVKHIAVLLVGGLAGCGIKRWAETRHERICSTPDERGALAAGILACVKNGNPMSDEEGEDLVKQCELSMTNTVCPERRVMVYLRDSEPIGVGYEYDRRLLP